MSARPPRTVAIVGPTCTGKSAVGLAVALHHGGEIVNADALQVYRGFDLGTAKPDAEARTLVPHHLIDALDPRARFSAGEFARRARAAIEGVERRGRLAVVVGGSGFYVRALFRGLAAIPPVPESVRSALRDRLAREGLDALRAELVRRDPALAGRLDPADRQRTLRALEVLEATGRPLSVWQEEQESTATPHRSPALLVGLTLERSVLYDRIAARAYEMLRAGWLDEVRELLRAGVPESAPAFQAIGYRQLLRHLQGACTLDEAMAETIRATRQFAKRQETWFRRERVAAWFRSPDVERLAADVIEFVSRERSSEGS